MTETHTLHAPLVSSDENDGPAVVVKASFFSRFFTRRNIIMLVLSLFGLGFLAYYFLGREKSEARSDRANGEPTKRKSFVTSLLGGLKGFDKNGDAELDEDMTKTLAVRRDGVNTMLSNENSNSLLHLAKRIRDSGLRLKGVSQCRFTQIQREAFGDRDSPARKIIESIYTECRNIVKTDASGKEVTVSSCPNIHGYPTWTLNDKHWPGNRSHNALRALVTEVEQLNPEPMLQGASEPQIENIPDAIHVETTGDEILTTELIKKMQKRIVEEDESNDYGNAVAEVEARKEATIHLRTNGTTTPSPTTGGADPAVEGGAAAGAGGGFAPDQLRLEAASAEQIAEDAPGEEDKPKGRTPRRRAAKKENVRGVSNYPPLNVPDMPGTNVFVLDAEMHDDQTRQGNVPRASEENDKATPGVLNQHLSTMLPEMTHVATRVPGASQISQNRYPHSSDITTGDAFSDKTIYVEKN